MTPAQAKKLAEAAGFEFYYSREPEVRAWVMYPDDDHEYREANYFTAAVLRGITPEQFAEVYLKTAPAGAH